VSFDRTHALRHFFASSLLADRVPITDVAAWLGHASPEITYEYYGHLMPDAPDRARAAIDNAMASLARAKPTSARNHLGRDIRRPRGTNGDSPRTRPVAARCAQRGNDDALALRPTSS
jgi:hypothetical protein